MTDTTPAVRIVPEKTKRKGHKRGSVGLNVGCECGWRSATWFGKSAMSNANGEWRSHVEHCL